MEANQFTLATIKTILSQLKRDGISYCHWKSNYHLEYALSAQEDLDILVEPQDFGRFSSILLLNGFKQADSITSKKQPGVFHFLGNDATTGALINFHCFTRVLTGDHFLKSWNFPFERMLLEGTRTVHGIKAPAPSSEVIVFGVRHIIKHTTPFDLIGAVRHVKETGIEYRWITDGLDLDEVRAKLARFLPEVSAQDFFTALDLLPQSGHTLDKIRAGLRVRKCMKKFQRYSTGYQTIATVFAIGKMAINKFFRKQKHMKFQTGGKIVAFVGPQATGKSTLIHETRKWLGAELSISSNHCGKPPSTLPTWIPNTGIPLARKIFSGYSTVAIEKEAEQDATKNCPLIFVVRKVILAYDRRSLLRKLYRQSRTGSIALSDRYPSDEIGAIDGATFTDEMITAQTSTLKRYLMKKERHIYDDICPPDIVVQLTISVEQAVKRNLERDKEGDQSTEYVRMRHSMARTPVFLRCPVIRISTDNSLQETIVDVKRKLWEHL